MLCICRAKYAPENLVSFFQKNIRTSEFFINDKYCSPCSCLTLDSWSTRTILWSRGTRWTRWQTSILTSLSQTFHIQRGEGGTFPWIMRIMQLFFYPTGMITFAKLSYFFFQGPTKCRSISLVCPPTPTSTADERRISLVKQVKFSWNHVFFLDISSCMKRRICS